MRTKRQKKSRQRVRRHGRVRAKILGTGARPRLAVFRSNRSVYAQLIDDEAGKTITAADSRGVSSGTPVEKAREVGKQIAKDAQKKKISSVVFDRGGFLYTGQVAAVAEGAREGGLTF